MVRQLCSSDWAAWVHYMKPQFPLQQCKAVLLSQPCQAIWPAIVPLTVQLVANSADYVPTRCSKQDGVLLRRLYAFDVHCNSYFPLFLLLYGEPEGSRKQLAIQ